MSLSIFKETRKVIFIQRKPQTQNKKGVGGLGWREIHFSSSINHPRFTKLLSYLILDGFSTPSTL
jgi:hypothetical protein